MSRTYRKRTDNLSYSNPKSKARSRKEHSKKIENKQYQTSVKQINKKSENKNIKDPERTAAARASCIWNLLYTDDYIVPGDAVYMFDTNLMSEQDLERIDPKFNDIKEKIRKNVFRVNSLGMNFSSFGLKAFAIPVNGNTKKLPEWIIPFIRIDSMIQKHLQPITSLYSSLLLSPARYQSEGSSTKKMGTSTLIRF